MTVSMVGGGDEGARPLWPESLLALQSSLQGDLRPDFICVVQSLLMAAGEEKIHGDMKGALRDLKVKFAGGLNAIFYKDVPYLPVYISAGSIVQFGILRPDGQVLRILIP